MEVITSGNIRGIKINRIHLEIPRSWIISLEVGEAVDLIEVLKRLIEYV